MEFTTFAFYAVIASFTLLFVTDFSLMIKEAWNASAPVPVKPIEAPTPEPLPQTIETEVEPVEIDIWDAPITTPALIIEKENGTTQHMFYLPPVKTPGKPISKMVKAELIAELQMWVLPTNGTVPELRKRLAAKY